MSEPVEIVPGTQLPKGPILVYLPPNTMKRGSRFVWGGRQYLVVSRTDRPWVLWLAPWSRTSRFLLWLGWGLWEDREPHPSHKRMTCANTRRTGGAGFAIAPVTSRVTTSPSATGELP